MNKEYMGATEKTTNILTTLAELHGLAYMAHLETGNSELSRFLEEKVRIVEEIAGVLGEPKARRDDARAAGRLATLLQVSDTQNVGNKCTEEGGRNLSEVADVSPEVLVEFESALRRQWGLPPIDR